MRAYRFIIVTFFTLLACQFAYSQSSSVEGWRVNEGDNAYIDFKGSLFRYIESEDNLYLFNAMHQFDFNENGECDVVIRFFSEKCYEKNDMRKRTKLRKNENEVIPRLVYPTDRSAIVNYLFNNKGYVTFTAPVKNKEANNYKDLSMTVYCKNSTKDALGGLNNISDYSSPLKLRHELDMLNWGFPKNTNDRFSYVAKVDLRNGVLTQYLSYDLKYYYEEQVKAFKKKKIIKEMVLNNSFIKNALTYCASISSFELILYVGDSRLYYLFNPGQPTEMHTEFLIKEVILK